MSFHRMLNGLKPSRALMLQVWLRGLGALVLVVISSQKVLEEQRNTITPLQITSY